MKISCLIVDDEFLSLQLLDDYVKKIPELQLIKKCKSATEAKQIIDNESVDLIFLDIQMPDFTGLELLETLDNKPVVIFTTAYLDYAIEGFRLQAIDYLLKPFSFERFRQGAERAIEYILLKRNNGKENSELPTDYIYVKTDSKVSKIVLEEILYIEGLREYVSIYTTEERIISLLALKNLEAQLPSNKFLRVHKSYLVAINKIEVLKSNSLTIANKIIPIGQTYKEVIKEKLKAELRHKLL